MKPFDAAFSFDLDADNGCTCPRFLVAGTPASLPRGTGGPQVPQMIFRTVVPLSMLAFTTALHHINVINSTHRTKNPKHFKIKSKQSTKKILHRSVSGILQLAPFPTGILSWLNRHFEYSGMDQKNFPNVKRGELKMTKIKLPTTHVRFNSDEYERIRHDASVTGTSIPKLLKDAYFARPILNPLLRHDDLKMMMGQLGRIGNNLNQVAKQLNTGFRAGFNDDLEEIREAFTRLVTFITSTYGRTSEK